MKNVHIVTFVAGLLFITGCVPPMKFKALQQQNDNCMQEQERLKTENDNLSAENKEMKSAVELLQQNLKKSAQEENSCKVNYADLELRFNQIKKDYDDLREAQQVLLRGSEQEIRKLMSDLQLTQEDLQQKESDLIKLSQALDEKKKNLENTEAELKQRNARLSELETVLKEQEKTVIALKKAVSDALTGFENEGLTVTQKKGKVYVSLEEKLLFPSGSATVDPKGAVALKKLTGVLEKNPDISIMIEGHTDDVPVKPGSSYKDNWDLSVLRATSVVRILLQDSSIDPKRLTVSGRGEFFPLDPAKTPEARQKNRRTEIILSPKLEALYKLIE
jgi:chemotaxis protein MotB